MAGAEGLRCCAMPTAGETTQHFWESAALTSSGVSFHLYLGDSPLLVPGVRRYSVLLLKYERNVMMRKKSNSALEAVCR